ncbi:NAD(P)-dependent dehydrogenase (short-subunit alcohol dehydrogenase family) [Peribacillus deserti]|uniref:NAD(P)-dependent dehydrogenase (Short-subunit alcohol dehydrogenase family) n=1 Tax=Peribacillus deserti TaxID=673318 RepID=A0ABS2QKL0_9BACI|nr:SDR family NAD(P)-dependent oxidoreductase [Peribacillus deserti]MBM7693699.1 NAD(P)-dependent dehydrogenase (short-subunit alcohol dehydrogenase family) [Peribacillus deserti]
MSNNQNKTAVVTGGGSGIGAATAIKLAKEGYQVCLIDIKEDKAAQVKEEIDRAGGDAFVLDVDVSDPARVREAISKVHQKWGRVDVLFANAGINGTVTSIEEMDPDEWDRTITTNLRSTFLFVKYTIPHMKQTGGSIIITSSINGNRTFKNIGMSAYSTSKAGQTAFMKMAALELARYKIRVNAICPGAIATNIDQNTFTEDDVKEVKIPIEYPEGNQPLENAPGKPEQVADLVYFLASEQSSHITGTEIYIDGAESLL